IGKRAITVTPNPDQSKVYGALDPTFAYSPSESLLASNSFTGALERAGGETVGAYAYTLGNLAAGDNYSISLAVTANKFEVTPLPVTVTANADQGKVYGQAEPGLAFTASPAVGTVLPNGAVIGFSGSIQRAGGEGVGAYAINQNSLANSNYIINYIGADFTISPAQLNLVVANKTKVYGEAVPTLTGTVTGLVSTDGITVNYSTTATQASDVVAEGYPIVAAINDPNAKLSNYTVSNSAGVLTINKATATIAITPYSGTYDGFEHTASGTATGVFGEDLSAALTFAESYTNVPGGSTTWAFSGGTNYNNTNGTTTVTITPQTANPVADAFYTGSSFYWTTSSTSSTATLALTATIQNNLNYSGDIRTAKVSFFIRNGSSLTPINGAQNLPVGLVTPGDLSVGTATANVQYNIGNSAATTLTIAVVVSGNYRSNPNDPTTDNTCTIAKPTPGGLIGGAGYLDNATSAGYVKGAPDKKTKFDFFVEYNKSMKNFKGGVTITVKSYLDRNGVASSELHTYKLKSNAISVLAIKGSTAQFSGKANISEIFADGREESIEGNCSMQLDMTDVLNTGRGDQLAVIIHRAKGGVWYTNNWNGSKSVQSVVVNEGRWSSELSVTGSGGAITATATKAVSMAETTLGTEFYNYPNAFSDRTTIVFSVAKEQNFVLEVYDVKGALVKKVATGVAEANKQYEYELESQRMSEGIYFGRLTTTDGVQTVKMILKK
uniref:MBG domain-containing protein n=1 Tax=Pontibacter beigongshangensis TaxID=2574733 RepID=UPI001650587F